MRSKPEYRYGYLDDSQNDRPFRWKVLPLIFALLFLSGSWLLLNQKILFGSNWMSETYDTVDWRTNEGNLQTYGAWDLEAHVWKSMFIMENWPNVLWNPYWYLGMPLFKYYQPGFYAVHIGTVMAFDLNPAQAANMIVIFGHLAAVLMTFFLCLRVSRRYLVSALCAFFLLANTFLSLRSYGWEPITVVFLALFPLGLLVFLRQPLRPFRFWMVMVLTISYLMHPLIWFSLCMTIGIYLFALSIASSHRHDDVGRHHVLTKYFVLVICSLLLGAVQSVAQFSYEQVTSGAHMGVKYLPFYHVPTNVITMQDFFFDYMNLKGPGPIVMLAFLFLIVFSVIHWHDKRRDYRAGRERRETIFHPVLRGFALTVFVMVLFYYLEAFNIFPMNFLRSVQYHRIIPEFIIVSAALIAAMAVIVSTRRMKVFYYGTLFSFVIGGFLVLYTIQGHWATVPSIEEKPEFFTEDIPGRISMTYTEQSLSVRSSFTKHPQVYGYYEQGVTNSYADELFSVSSGFHNESVTTLYLRAADVSRLYVNREAGARNEITQLRFNGTLPYTDQNYRYAYYSIPLANPSFAQAVPGEEADYVLSLKPGCRELFKEEYCGSVGEEFVSKDLAEQEYLTAYVNMLENPYDPHAEFTMVNPDYYSIDMRNATTDTAVVIKMTRDDAWRATADGKRLEIEDIGPDFMLVRPGLEGDYNVRLVYTMPKEHIIGAVISVITFIGLCLYFIIKPTKEFAFPEGDMRSR
jgi:hypothetical protein